MGEQPSGRDQGAHVEGYRPGRHGGRRASSSLDGRRRRRAFFLFTPQFPAPGSLAPCSPFADGDDDRAREEDRRGESSPPVVAHVRSHTGPDFTGYGRRGGRGDSDFAILRRQQGQALKSEPPPESSGSCLYLRNLSHSVVVRG